MCVKYNFRVVQTVLFFFNLNKYIQNVELIIKNYKYEKMHYFDCILINLHRIVITAINLYEKNMTIKNWQWCNFFLSISTHVGKQSDETRMNERYLNYIIYCANM